MTLTWSRNGLLLAVSLALSPMALAHGGQEHVMGTVVSADAKSIIVKTTKGAETTIQVDEKTKVERSGSDAKISDVTAGERVVVHAHKSADGLTATMIKVGATKADAPKAHQHGH